jgi:hypothetical protein
MNENNRKKRYLPPNSPASIITTKITAVRDRVRKVARFRAIDADEFGMGSFNIQNTKSD